MSRIHGKPGLAAPLEMELVTKGESWPSIPPVVNTVSRASRFLFGCVLILTLSTRAGEPPARSVARDWAKDPAVRKLSTIHDVIAVGDVHGDYDRLVELLAVNHVIESLPSRPEAVRWAAGQSILVCTGDLIDRWTNGIAVIRCFQALQKEARQAGGDVIVTMGNHEAAFLAATSKHERFHEFSRELRAAAIDPDQVRRGADPEGLGAFLRSLPIVAVINDWCFVHAGNFQGRTLEQIQTDLEQDISAHGFGAGILSDPDSMLEARLRPNPWWEEGAAGAVEAEANLRKAVEMVGCHHLVTGHQPKAAVLLGERSRKAGELTAEFNGLLFLIDTGMSRGVGLSAGALLWIDNDQGAAWSLSATGVRKELWRVPIPVAKPGGSSS